VALQVAFSGPEYRSTQEQTKRMVDASDLVHQVITKELPLVSWNAQACDIVCITSQPTVSGQLGTQTSRGKLTSVEGSNASSSSASSIDSAKKARKPGRVAQPKVNGNVRCTVTVVANEVNGVRQWLEDVADSADEMWCAGAYRHWFSGKYADVGQCIEDVRQMLHQYERLAT
jgi:hypothetical protein